jgi:hypothetical protein
MLQEKIVEGALAHNHPTRSIDERYAAKVVETRRNSDGILRVADHDVGDILDIGRTGRRLRLRLHRVPGHTEALVRIVGMADSCSLGKKPPPCPSELPADHTIDCANDMPACSVAKRYSKRLWRRFAWLGM